MSARPLAAVVLAAGEGKRLEASLPKVLVEAAGRPLVEYVLDALEPLGADPVVVVYGHGGSAVTDALAGRGLVFAHQDQQLGTGHAVQCALPALSGFAGDVLVLCGDTPLLSAPVLAGLMADHRATGRDLTLLSARLDDPGSLGRVLRTADGALVAIREAADASAEEQQVKEVNTGVLVCEAALLAEEVRALGQDNVQGEYYLTDVPGQLLARGKRVGVHVTEDAGAAFGVNRPEELERAGRELERRAAEKSG